MKKAELVEAVAAKAGLTKADSDRAIKAFAEVVTGALKKGEKVAIPGFGTFSVSKRAAREGRNPQTGAKIKIPASKQPKFRAGKGLKDAVNK